MALEVFDKDYDEYLKWMKDNPESFVVNTEKKESSNKFVLHISECPNITSIKGFSDKDIYTKKNTKKVCSNDLNELINWFKDKKNSANFEGSFTECGSCEPFSKRFFDNLVSLFPEIIEIKNEKYSEGSVKQITVNKYERDLKARKKCLEAKGYSCSVCKIDFEKVYGIIGKSFIHVHHLKELCSIGKKYKVNPITDLVPVCPNCHAMLHQRKPCYTIDELKSILK